MRQFYLHSLGILLLLLICGSNIQGQTVQEYSPDFRSTPDAVSGNVLLQWNDEPGVEDWDIFIRNFNTVPLTYLGTAPPPVTSVNVTGTVVGVHYEFQLRKNFTNTAAQAGQLAIAHLSTGTQVPFNDQRGVILLVTENQSVASLSAKVDRLIDDLLGDGWCVKRITCDRTETPAQVKARIVTEYNANPTEVRAVFLLGRVPVPYSGNIAPDAHIPDHQGAWPADGYYGDIDGVWTDATVNNAAATRAENQNIPGDGKFDHDAFPSDVELWVGRVDFANMPTFVQTEEQLIERYLDKNHAFRHRQVTLQRRGLIRDGFGYLGGEAPGRNAITTFQSLFGAANITSIAAGQYFTTLAANDYLFTYGSGGGSYTSASNVGNTADFSTNSPRAAFQMLFGSYFGDWDSQNNFLRASIAADGFSVGSVWASRPNYHFHMMGMGEPIGQAIKMTMNNRAPNVFLWAGASAGGVHIALMGDPTLRLHPVLPPSNLTAQLVNGNAEVKLDWNASTDTDLEGYHIYKLNPATGCYVRLTATLQAGLTFTDPNPTYNADNRYMVRVVKHETSTTGDYFNGSQGIFVTIFVPTPACATLNPVVTQVACNGGSTGSITLTPTGGTGPFNYQWTKNSVNFATTKDITGLTVGTYAVTVTDALACVSTSEFIITQPPALTVTLDAVQTRNVICFGQNSGRLYIDVAGGTPNAAAPLYNYQWTRDAANVATIEDLISAFAGDYAVTVTDANGCTATLTHTITEPAELEVNPVVVNVSCPGGSDGSITPNLTGGVQPYDIEWELNSALFSTQENITNLAAGTYTFIVTDANGCSGTVDITVTEPATGVSVALTDFTNETCAGANNGTINVTASNGTGPYTYNWNKDGNPFSTNEDLTGLGNGLYALTVTDNGGCTATLIHNIGAGASGPSVALTAFTDETCSSANNGTINITASAGTGPYTYSWNKDGNPFSTNEDLTALDAAQYAVTVTDANNCTATLTQNIGTGAGGPTVTIASFQNPTCATSVDGSVLINITGTGPFTFAWTRNGNPFSTLEDLTAVGGGAFAVTVTDASGCTGTASQTLTPGAGGPTVAITTFTHESCAAAANGAINITATGTGPFTYSWTRNAAAFSTNEDLTGISGGTYAVTVTDAGGCTGTASQVINTGTGITVTVTTTTHPACNGQSNGAIDITPSGGTPGYTYAWTKNGNPAGTNQDQSNVSAGNYAVTVTDVNNCTGTANVTLNDPAILTVSLNAASNTQIDCAGQPDGDLNIDVNGGTPAYTYAWTKNGNPAGTSQDLTGQTGGNYAVTVTDSRGCFVTLSQAITEPTAINAAIGTVQQPTCAGGGTNGSINLTVSGGTPGYLFNWTKNGTPHSTSQNIASLGAGAYAVTITDANNCTVTLNQVINPTPTVTVNIGGSTNEGCAGSNGGAISLAPVGGTAPYTYQWTKDGGAFTGGQVLTNLGAGQYAATVTDAGGCTGTTTVTLTAFALPNVTASTPAPVCVGQQATITANGATNYTWNPGNLNGASVNVSPNTTTTYTVVGTDANNCTGSATAIVTVNQLPNVGATASPGTTFCSGQCVDLTGTGANSYSWMPGSLSGTSVNVCPVATTTYTVTGTSAAGCTATHTVTLTQGTGNVDVTITNSSNVSCNGGNDGFIQTQIVTGAAPFTYVWKRNGNTIAQTSANVNNLTAGSYEVIVTDGSGCSDVATVAVTEPQPLSVIQIVQSDPLCANNCDGSIEVIGNGGTGPYTYAWASGESTAEITQLCGGTYTVNLTDANNCQATQQYQILVPAPITGNIVTNGNTLDLTVSGGTPGYSFFWNTGATTEDLVSPAVGAYNVLVEDANGCVEMFTGVFGATPLVLTQGVIKHPSCAGGSDGEACVVASGGQAPYTYLWSNNGQVACTGNLSNGTYTVTVVDALGQVAELIVGIVEPQPLILSLTQQGTPCAGGADLFAAVTGGTQPYTYAWNTGASTATVNVLGEELLMSVTITDAKGCTITGERFVSCCAVEISNIRSLLNSANMLYVAWNTTPSPAPTGTRYFVRYRVNGSGQPWTNDPNVSFQPMFAIRNLQPGLCYDVEVRAQCPGGFNTGLFAPPSCLSTFTPVTTCQNSPPSMPTGFQVRNVTPTTVEIHWNTVTNARGYIIGLGLADQPVNLWTTYQICDPAAVKLDIQGLVPNRQYATRIRTICSPCSLANTSQAILSAYTQPVPFSTPTLRIDDAPNAQPFTLSVYPNPNRGQFMLRFEGLSDQHEAEVRLTDLTGRTLISRTIDLSEGTHEEPFWLEGYASGLYLLTVRQGGSTQTLKLMVE